MNHLTQKVLEACATLAGMTEEPGRITRTFLSGSMHQVHVYLRHWMECLGMRVWLDAVGNLRGVYGGEENVPTLLLGSHLDTVPNAGAYDGVLGVVLGIALVEAQQGRKLPYSIEIVGFSEEEGVRFQTPFIGSKAMAGVFDARLLDLTDVNGASLAQAIREYGLDPNDIPDAAIEGGYLGFLEFHIEQGPVLEAEKLNLGIVEAISGQSRLEFTFRGRSSHAGCTPMRLRQDALTGVATFVLAVDHKARNTPGLVATIGQMQVMPGAVNVIPGEVRHSLDIRHANDEVRKKALGELLEEAQKIARQGSLEVSWVEKLEQPALAMDPGLRQLLAQALQAAGYAAFALVSGAGHDAQIMAERMPVAMLFLRSPGGLSHHPDETVLEGDVEAALKVGMRFLELLEAKYG